MQSIVMQQTDDREGMVIAVWGPFESWPAAQEWADAMNEKPDRYGCYDARRVYAPVTHPQHADYIPSTR